MASIVVSDDDPNQQQQSLIPVLTVFKNNSILKNIIILNNNNNNDDDQILLVGRHPNCNIVLFHPSISRFHLQIRITPSSRSISLLDLSSVHGTWVCGKKLEHGVSVDLKEGDSFQLGSSSRVYFLQFVSQFDDVDALKNIGSLGCDDERKDQSNGETFEDENDSFGTETSCCNGENKLCGCHFCLLSPPYTQSVDEADNMQMSEACPEVEMPGETNLFCTLRECFKQNICIPVAEAVQGSKLHQQSSTEKQLIDPKSSFNEKGDGAGDEMPKESEFEGTFEYIVTTGARVFNSADMPDSESHQTNTDEEVSADSLSGGEKQGSCGEDYESELQNLNANSYHKQQYSPDEIVEDIGKQCIENMDPAFSDENGLAALSVTPKEHKLQFFFEENDRIDNILTSVAGLFNSENTSSLVEEAIHHVTNFQQINIVEEIVTVDSLSDEEKENKCDVEFKAYLNIKPCDEGGNSLDETVEETVKSFQTESLNPLSGNTSSLVEEAIPVTNYQLINIVEEVAAVDLLSDEEKENKCDAEFKAYLYVKPCDEEGNSLDETVEETVKSFQAESLNPLSGNTSSLVEEAIAVTNFQLTNIVEEVAAVDSLSDEEKENKCDEEFKAYLYVKPCDEEGNSRDETVEETVKSFQTESLNPSSKNTSSLVEEAISVTNFQLIDIVEEVADVDSLSDEEKENKCDEEFKAYLYVKPCDEEGNSLDETVEETVKSFQAESLNPSVTQESDITDKKENQTPQSQESDLEITEKKENQTPQFLVAVAGCFAVKFHESCVEESAEGSLILGSDILSRRDKAASAPQVRTQKSRLLNTPNVDTKFVMSNLKDINIINKPMPKNLFSDLDEEEMFTPNMENSSPTNTFHLQFMRKKGVLEESKSSKSQRAHNLKASFSPIIYSAERSTSAISNKENRTPREDKEWKSQMSHNLKANFSPIIYSAERSPSAISNKENQTPREAQEWKSQRSHNLKANFSPIIYSTERSTSAISNKENLTPREAHEWKSQRSHNLRASFSPIIYSAERSASTISNKENLTPKEALEWMSGRKHLECRNTTESRKKRVERIPLQSLMSSGGNHNSNFSPFSAAKSIAGVTARANNCGHISDEHAEPSRITAERKRSWDLVVDTSSLLNKESRKALQLLQGLKGTRLIIPQSVMRELGSMKQQIGIFRRISEAALALEWIEECIGKTKCWIHIQSSMEDEFMLIAPTPPTHFNEDVLDCALQYRRKDNVGQIVLLSDDVNLKIKSMAKGLLCETVQQFRRSLVNPFSERFMWANSSPRGLTWSCRDDVVLREKYCCLPSKAGLKLLAT